ncbi:MAG: GHKL domain-containing protein, partial [Candidatus Omnitrophica bacterium]|nr:GHKL domain-containing protein [Candidatus Omnitrophota bacterium]
PAAPATASATAAPVTAGLAEEIVAQPTEATVAPGAAPANLGQAKEAGLFTVRSDFDDGFFGLLDSTVDWWDRALEALAGYLKQETIELKDKVVLFVGTETGEIPSQVAKEARLVIVANPKFQTGVQGNIIVFGGPVRELPVYLHNEHGIQTVDLIFSSGLFHPEYREHVRGDKGIGVVYDSLLVAMRDLLSSNGMMLIEAGTIVDDVLESSFGRVNLKSHNLSLLDWYGLYLVQKEPPAAPQAADTPEQIVADFYREIQTPLNVIKDKFKMIVERVEGRDIGDIDWLAIETLLGEINKEAEIARAAYRKALSRTAKGSDLEGDIMHYGQNHLFDISEFVNVLVDLLKGSSFEQAKQIILDMMKLYMPYRIDLFIRTLASGYLLKLDRTNDTRTPEQVVLEIFAARHNTYNILGGLEGVFKDCLAPSLEKEGLETMAQEARCLASSMQNHIGKLTAFIEEIRDKRRKEILESADKLADTGIALCRVIIATLSDMEIYASYLAGDSALAKSEKIQGWLSDISRGIPWTKRLLNEFVTGERALDKKEVNLTEVLSSLIIYYQERRGIKLVGRYPERLLAAVDVYEIEVAIHNLVSNSIESIKKAPWQGVITISAELAGNEVVIKVSDNGVGMSEETIERFRRGAIGEELTTKYRESGIIHGMGLYIVRRIVEAHGGSIDVESELLKGATFTIRLPIAQPTLAPAVSAAAIPAISPQLSSYEEGIEAIIDVVRHNIGKVLVVIDKDSEVDRADIDLLINGIGEAQDIEVIDLA